MKFRTKLIITFLIVILLPILLSGIAFIAVGAMVSYNSDLNFQIEISDDSTLSDSLASLSNTTNMMYIRLENIAEEDERRLEDKAFLEGLSAIWNRCRNFSPLCWSVQRHKVLNSFQGLLSVFFLIIP